jgi:hypothetical protein
MGDDGSGSNNFATTTIAISLCSLVSVAPKKKKNNKQRRINKDKRKKIVVRGLQET